MTEYDAYWTEQAREEFRALFDDADHSDRFRHLVADALVRGWSNNKDKPFWALGVVVGTLGEIAGAAARHQGRPAKAGGLEILSNTPAELWQTLAEAAADKVLDPENRISASEQAGGLQIAFDGTSITLSRTRLAVLRKLAEFLLVCDEFAFAQEMTNMLARLASDGLGNAEAAKQDIRAIARVAYAYRSKHFRDTGAQSAFGLLMQFMSGQPEFAIKDDCVIEFWGWDRNDKYRTYSASFGAFSDFYDVLKEVTANREFANSSDIQDPLIESMLATHEDPESALIEAEQRLLEVPQQDEEDDAEEWAAEPASQRVPEVIDHAPMKLLAVKDLRLLQHLTELGSFGFAFPRASLRLISFHPVQSGLSNALRTGRSKLSLGERISCVEAIPYDIVQAKTEAIENRMSELLKAAFSRRDPGDLGGNDFADKVRRDGVVVLANIRARRGGRDGASSTDEDWRAVEPALIEAKRLATMFTERVRRIGGHDGTSAPLKDWFSNDKQVFSAQFNERYAKINDACESDPKLNGIST